MKKEKMYFEIGNDESCYPLDYFQDRIGDGEKEILLQEARQMIGDSSFWCKELGEPFEDSSEACGLHACDTYKPRNGKNGCCVHRGFCYEPSGKELTLTEKGLTP